MRTNIQRLLSTFLAIFYIALLSAQITINLDAGSRGPKIGNTHYGIFFEEINHAGDGGLYAELIHNRSFEDNQTWYDKWWPIGNTAATLVSEGLINKVQTRALKLTLTGAGSGVRNEGFWGINAVSGRTYKFSFWAKSDAGYNGTLTVGLQTEGGNSLGAESVNVNLNGEWTKITGEFTATGSNAVAWFSLTGSKAGEITIDVVSLFPPTYKDRENGCRIDLAEKLEAIHPSFVRFPGGCYVEGEWRNGKTNRFEWKNTIGPIEERPGHYCVNWNYNVSDGFGFHEMLQLTEDLNAEPLFVVNMGMGHGWMVPYDEIDEFIDEALDAIEYCNGDVTTEWGAKRAANGHPEPFGLRLIEIGNENYNFTSTDNRDQSDHYAERYIQFYNAIKAKYPDMVIIGDVEAWGTDNPSWRNPHPVDAVDEHYYRHPAWFVSQYSKYDSRDRSLPKVYVGEYAVTSDFGTTGHLRAALGEAVYMLGMENNSDVCVMNSYAPIFVNENDQKWKPDMIRFDSDESFGTPSYHVQRLFPNNVGKQNIKWTEENNEIGSGDKFGLSTWSTAATFDNVKVTGENGNIIFSDDFSTSSNWTSPGTGSWSVNSGTLIQTSTSMQGAVYLCNTGTGTNNYTIELDATKTSGAEGFLVAFRYTDSKNYCWWNLGGWNNGQHGVEMCVDGTKTTVASAAGSLTTGKTYHIKIEVAGSAVKCYLDDKLIHDFVLPTERKVYISSNIDDEAGLLYVKMVNPTDEDAPMTINLSNADIDAGTLILMTGGSEDENTMANKQKVYPSETTLTGINGNRISYTAPAHSLNILKLEVSNIESSSNTGQQANEETIEAFKKEMNNAMCRVNFIHTAMMLPTTSPSGATMVWNLHEELAGYLSLTTNGMSYTLAVNKLAEDEKILAGTLTASVTFADGSVADIDYPVYVAPDDEMYGYLYCFMNPNYEITNFALGTKEDKGKVFNVLLNGEEVFDTEAIAKIEGGTRDAFILRGEKANQYLMACTDMCNRKSEVWNNYGMDLLTSPDLIHWEGTTFDFRQGKSVFSDPDATTDCYKTDDEYAKINRVWAPQIIWDESVNKYLVYYSLLSTNTGDSYDKIYYSYADEDFKTLTQPRMFFDPGFSVIDADILYNPYDGLYHMYYKRESAGGQDRGVYEATSPMLVGGTWTDITHVTNEGTAQVEGSSHIRRINEDTYNLYYMRYSEGYVYKVCETNHVGLNTTASVDLKGTGSFQHGSFITLTETEYKMLEMWDQLKSLLPSYYNKLENGISYYEAAIAQAEAALKLTTVNQLAVELARAYEALLEADERYNEDLMGGATEGEPIDITSLIVNADFSDGGNGWEGTVFTAANGYIAEQWNKTFDNYQVLKSMPAGHYVLSCQGYYRYGNNSTATSAHKNGTEQMLANIYINTISAPVMCIYDESYYSYEGTYTYPDNVTQANQAFNNRGHYQDNSVEFILEETGDLKIGIRKTVAFESDWTIFDNFKLMYYGSTESGNEITINRIKNDIKDATNKLNFLHTIAELPTSSMNGATISWSLKEKYGDYISFANNTITVEHLATNEKVMVGIVTASITLSDGSVTNIDYDVWVAPDDEMYGYLYCFMNPNYEITNFALGTKEDKGKVFNVLLNGEEVFDTEAIAKIEGGTRDAFILRGEKANQYLMACTDMCYRKSGIWNNYGMDLLTSPDLIHWEGTTFDFRQGKSVFSDPDATTDCYKTDDEYAKINRVWAPQIIWDESVNKYLVYYSLLSTNTGDSYDKIYYSYADEDFKTLTQPRMFFDPGFSVIDADILYNPYDGLYHMYYKRESAGGQDRGVYEATSPMLVGGTWTDITHVTNEGTAQVEGSSHIRRINEDTYNLYYMRYSEGYVYKVCETNHVGLNTTASVDLKGTGSFQHGSFITLTETEYKMLEMWDKLRNLLDNCRTKKQETGTNVFDSPIADAETALSLISVDVLLPAMTSAYEELLKAQRDFYDIDVNNASEENPVDLTALIINNSFETGDLTGWTLSGSSSDTGIRANSNNTYKTNGVDGSFLFNSWWQGVPITQVVPGLPNGKYQLKVLIASGDDGGDDGQVYVTANDQRKLVVRPAGTKTTFEDVTLDFTVTDGTATFGVRGGNVDGSYREDGYFWYKADNFRLYFLGNELTLDEKDSELNLIEDFYTKVTIQRTIKADTWSTFVVPFDMEIPDGWEVKGLTDAKINNDIVSMVFSSAPSISSGVPYMIRTKSSLSEIVANNVDVTNTMNDTPMNMVTFKGTYTSGYVPQNAYFMSGNKFYKAGDESNTIKGYRAYFEVNDENKVNELRFSLDEEETSFIQIKENLQDEVIYNTNGVRLKGLQKGVNIIKRPDGTTIKLVIK